MKKILLSLAVLSAATIGCTKLDEGLYDRQVADQFYATPEGVNAALADIYNEIRGDWGGKGYAGADRGWFDLNETCTDELMLPTRSDGAWADNGIWRQMYLHQWTSSQEFMNNTWNWLYRTIYKCNLAVDLLTKANAPEAAIAEAKVLRAFYYWMLMDGWGNIPFYTDINVTVDKVPQASRATVYNFIETELKANIDKLSTTKGGSYYGRFNKWAGYAFLAKLYLNAGVYTGTPKWAEAQAATDVIINQGGFSLVNSYLSLFGDRCPDQEVLLAIFIDANQAPRNIIGIRSLAGPHGNALFGISTWNGATAHQDFINKYENGDVRKAQWLTGAQPGGVTYDVNISSLTSAGIYEGARSAKYLPALPLAGNGSASNDFPVFRYADVFLMKAECLVRTGNAGAAKALVDQIRSRAGLPASGTNPTLNDIYDERGRELCWEGHRRQDMIRFDRFTAAHDFKPVSDNKYKLFPIPAPAFITNKSLVQNPGY